MTSISFDHKVLVEQVRGIESEQELTMDAITDGSGNTATARFDDRLLHRAQRLSHEHELQETLAHAPGIWRISFTFAIAIAVILGALATMSAVSGGSTINIYWLLLVLVGFNLLSMILWLVGVSGRVDDLVTGVWARASTWIPTLLSKRKTTTGQADNAWLSCHLAGPVGKWRGSQVTQQIWLVYLCTGLVMLVLVLMARQFDFVWGTTLLSDTSFVQLTTALGKPLQALGFATPSAQQVIETRIGAGFTLTADHRYGWAQFLLGSLLVFGILPRLVFWGASTLLLKANRKNFALDYYLPYYVHLRQELMPMHGSSEIVDADTVTPATPQETTTPPLSQPAANHVSPGAAWVAIELDDDIGWPLASMSADKNLGQITDRASLERALQQVQASADSEIAIAVLGSRAPDRGIKRTVSALREAAASTWLVLIDKAEGDVISQARLTAWYRLAQECQVPAENVVTTSGDPQ